MSHSEKSDFKLEAPFLQGLCSGERLVNARAKKMEIFDSRMAIARLVGTILFLGAVAGAFTHFDAAQKFLAIIFFFIFFMIASFLHDKIRSKTAYWKALVQVFQQSQLRLNRQLKDVSLSPWHLDAVKTIPKGHAYAADLDIAGGLFPWLDTCSTPEGTQLLCEQLLNGGIHPLPELERLQNLQRAQLLSADSRVVREWESVRYDLAVQTQIAQESQKISIVESLDSTQTVLSGWPATVRIAYSVLAIIAWFILLIPALVKFFATAQTDDLMSGLLLYAPFPILGIVLFQPLSQMASLMRRRSQTFLRVVKLMNRAQLRQNKLSFVCVRDNSEFALRRFVLFSDFLQLRSNPIFWLAIHILFPFDAFVCLCLGLSARSVLPRFKLWWNEAVEFDVLCAWARVALENPSMSFVAQSENHAFQVEQMGHPLIAANVRVCNSLSLHKGSPLVLLTGSNMAGKSTFLRTLGVNSLLHNLGGPVCARVFNVQPMRIYCAIKVDDSLQDGTSYFYAEVKRLKFILEVLNGNGAQNSLFLVDEIFRGTNNRERYIGSRSMLLAFLNTQAFGVVSTHDLALAQLSESDSRLVNMHFREHVSEGKLQFDFLLRPGACPTTNALRIMREAGLPVPEDDVAEEIHGA